MKKLYNAAVVWTVLGLAAGLFYRTYAQQIHHFDGATQLSVLHTHLLALGTLFMLITLALTKVFALDDMANKKMFNLFFWHYNGGLALSSLGMLIIGLNDAAGHESSKMLNGVAGLGHMILTVAFVFFFILLSRGLKAKN